MTIEQKSEELKKRMCTIDELEDICDTIVELLEWKADSIRKNEPYATVTIREIETAIRVVNDLVTDDEEY